MPQRGKVRASSAAAAVGVFAPIVCVHGSLYEYAGACVRSRKRTRVLGSVRCACVRRARTAGHAEAVRWLLSSGAERHPLDQVQAHAGGRTPQRWHISRTVPPPPMRIWIPYQPQPTASVPFAARAQPGESRAHARALARDGAAARAGRGTESIGRAVRTTRMPKSAVRPCAHASPAPLHICEQWGSCRRRRRPHARIMTPPVIGDHHSDPATGQGVSSNVNLACAAPRCSLAADAPAHNC